MATPLTIDGLPSASISAGSIIAVVTGGLAKRSTVGDIGQNFTTVVATTSVVTPLVKAASGAFSFGGNNTTEWISNGSLIPVDDNIRSFGSSGSRIASIFTPIIDSGTTGSLSLRTNNGTLGIELVHIASAVNWHRIFTAATGLPVTLLAAGEANTSLDVIMKGAGSFFVKGGATDDGGTGSTTQFRVVPTAGSTRWIDVTGSAAGNPTITTTAGSLNLAPALQFSTLGAFAASDKYLIVDSSGNVHKSALGPAS